MGIFRRMTDIMTANVHDLLDRAENPEKMVKQIVREMEEAVQAAKRNTAQVMASQKKLEKEIQTNKRLRDEWQKKAEQAVEMDRDDLARQALSRRSEHDNLVATLERQHSEGEGSVQNLRQTLKGLEAKLAEAKRQKMMLVARKRTADARIAAGDSLAKGADKSKSDAFAKFERLQEQVGDLEAEADALTEINAAEAAIQAEFDGLEPGADVELELLQLKKKAKKGDAKK